jgi:hypothetical protein
VSLVGLAGGTLAVRSVMPPAGRGPARGPLWSKARWVAIWQLNTGAFDDEVERWVARNRDLYRTP